MNPFSSGNSYGAAGQAVLPPSGQMVNPPEQQLARLLEQDLGVSINPQALRMFIRARWSRLSPLAHSIHGA